MSSWINKDPFLLFKYKILFAFLHIGTVGLATILKTDILHDLALHNKRFI